MRNHLLALLLLAAVPFSARAADPAADGWKSLFDGKTLDGWRVARAGKPTASFKAADGSLEAAGPDGWLEYLGPDNDRRPGEGAGWPEIYSALSIVNLKTLALEG